MTDEIHRKYVLGRWHDARRDADACLDESATLTNGIDAGACRSTARALRGIADDIQSLPAAPVSLLESDPPGPPLYPARQTEGDAGGLISHVLAQLDAAGHRIAGVYRGEGDGTDDLREALRELTTARETLTCLWGLHQCWRIDGYFLSNARRDMDICGLLTDLVIRNSEAGCLLDLYKDDLCEALNHLQDAHDSAVFFQHEELLARPR